MSTKTLARVELGTTSTLIYTQASVSAQIFAATVTNVTGSPATLTVRVIDSAGANTDANAQIIVGRAIAANTTVGISELVGHTIDAGQSVEALAGTASALVLWLSGEEST